MDTQTGRCRANERRAGVVCRAFGSHEATAKSFGGATLSIPAMRGAAKRHSETGEPTSVRCVHESLKTDSENCRARNGCMVLHGDSRSCDRAAEIAPPMPQRRLASTLITRCRAGLRSQCQTLRPEQSTSSRTLGVCAAAIRIERLHSKP